MQIRADISIDLVKIVQALIIMFGRRRPDHSLPLARAQTQRRRRRRVGLLDWLGRLAMSAASKPKTRRPGLRITRKRIIAFLLILLGIFIFVEAGSLDGQLITTLTFESTSLGEEPTVGSIPVPTSPYLVVIGLLFIISGGMNLAEWDELRSPPHQPGAAGNLRRPLHPDRDHRGRRRQRDQPDHHSRRELAPGDAAGDRRFRRHLVRARRRRQHRYRRHDAFRRLFRLHHASSSCARRRCRWRPRNCWRSSSPCWPAV